MTGEERIEDEVFSLVGPSKSTSNSTIGSEIGEASHFLVGPLSSAPKTFPTFSRTNS
uniref:Uncharacterized protein n=1 Tax=Nelumbo nucifera TaxID=4432 RepID=A0A822ZAI4_NELNU|nr:TPA_asm: hypothetical protein HUJ06_016240 [Nelumbo nucifera]